MVAELVYTPVYELSHSSVFWGDVQFFSWTLASPSERLHNMATEVTLP